MLSKISMASGMYWDQGGLCTGQRGTGPEGASRKKDLRVLVFNPLNPPPQLSGSSNNRLQLREVAGGPGFPTACNALYRDGCSYP